MSSDEPKRSETFTVAVYEAEEGGYWGEVLELPGCASQGESIDELRANVAEAIQGCLEAYAEGDQDQRRSVTTISLQVAVP